MENANPWGAVAPLDNFAARDGIWAARDHRYGGLASRYKDNHRRSIRVVDPFTATPMQFSTTLRADNWLLRNFSPGVISCTVPSGGLAFLEMGRVCSVHCDLVTSFPGDTEIADLVVTNRKGEEQEASHWAELARVAKLFGLVPKLRVESEIRANLTLLTNLDRVYQHLVLHDRDDEYQQHQILAAIPATERICVADLRNELRFSRHPLPTPEEFDAALFRLHRLGAASINLAEVSYGPSSIIARG